MANFNSNLFDSPARALSVDAVFESVERAGSEMVAKFACPFDGGCDLDARTRALIGSFGSADREPSAFREFARDFFRNIEGELLSGFYCVFPRCEYRYVIVEESDSYFVSGFYAVIYDEYSAPVRFVRIDLEMIVREIFGTSGTSFRDRISILCCYICLLCQLVPTHRDLVTVLSQCIALLRYVKSNEGDEDTGEAYCGVDHSSQFSGDRDE